MRQSQLFTKTLKEPPKDEKSINAQLLIRSGFIYKEMAGAYSYLPLGLKVLQKIEGIIREEMQSLGGQEILMTVLQPKNLWEETNRWSKEIGKVMYKCKEDGKELGLGPTHEEMLTDIVRRYVKSYEDLPLYVYQIQTKFRKEPRARSGLLRGREFGMKDLYSFHSSREDFDKYYEKVKNAYLKVFRRCGLKAIITQASGEGFTKDYTHEFQVLSEGGEDTIVYCPKKHFSQNKEVAKLREGSRCPECRGLLKEGRSIEVGNIFPLGTKYSEAMKAYFVDKEGRRRPIIMGCYGIGSSRAMGAIIEINHDKKGIIWPEEVAPFIAHLIPIDEKKDRRTVAERIYHVLQKQNIEVLYDDRKKKSVGEKFADADLIGIPYRLVTSKKTFRQKAVELKKRREDRIKLIKIKSLYSFLRSQQK